MKPLLPQWGHYVFSVCVESKRPFFRWWATCGLDVSNTHRSHLSIGTNGLNQKFTSISGTFFHALSQVLLVYCLVCLDTETTFRKVRGLNLFVFILPTKTWQKKYFCKTCFIRICRNCLMPSLCLFVFVCWRKQTTPKRRRTAAVSCQLPPPQGRKQWNGSHPVKGHKDRWQ